jgi:ABC-type phosphate transport system substrate-binding protein
MRSLALASFTALLLAATAPAPAAAAPVAETYALIVNVNNPSKDDADAAKKTIKTLYLKDLTRWPGGTDAKPYGREATSGEQAAFVAAVLGMSDAELARHWLRLKNLNGTTPPKEVDSDRLLLKHVSRHDGAFGVVKASVAKADGVRVLFEFTAPAKK